MIAPTNSANLPKSKKERTKQRLSEGYPVVSEKERERERGQTKLVAVEITIRGTLKSYLLKLTQLRNFHPNRGIEVIVKYENGPFPNILCV